MARGNHKQIIFRDRKDFEFFLTLLSSIHKKMHFKIHAYCLMTNHFHMIVETGNLEIWKIMKPLCQHYAEYYNERYEQVGHLFQGRYKSCLVQSDSYFLLTSRYIHMNPVKANIVKYPGEYPWSSYKAFMRIEESGIITTERTLSYFEKPKIYNYRQYVELPSAENKEQEKEIRADLGEKEENDY